MQVRLDKALVARGFASTRSRAQFMIKSGVVNVNEKVIEKISYILKAEDIVNVTREINPWVSRAALKLEYALKAFQLIPLNGIAMDIGASTGGFTEVLLAYGCSKVLAIDVGKGQLEKKLRIDPRILNLESVNAKNLDSLNLPDVDIIVCDASFISFSKVIKVPLSFAKAQCQLVALIKPQFEVGPQKVGKRGIVKEPKHQQEACQAVRSFLENEGWSISHLEKCPVLGSDGNLEFLIAANKHTI
jgi:23S rRNA (cytidine1920-2'-O)/16S rRNA (cytidine1409-2'-O)-methyltransferase